MEDIEPTEAEREQMRRINAFRRVSTGILAKWAWPLALAFCLLAAAFSAAIVRRSAASPARYGAATRLLFSPRQAPNVPPMGDRQLMGVLDRASLKRAAGERLADLSDASRARLDGDLSIEQERKPTNLFTLSAEAPTPEEAVAKVNAYAAVLIDEYAAYRSRDLDAWAATLEERAGDLAERIAALDAEEAVAKGGAGTVSPAETLALLNGLVSDQRRNLSRLGFELSDEEARRKRLEESAGDRASVVVACAPKIRRASAELAALDAQIAKLREKYTDENPLVKGKAADREALLGSFLAMLRENGLDGVGPADVERIEKAAAGLADAAARVETLEASRRSLEREIEENEARIARITAAIPVLERIRVDRDELSRGLRDLEEQRRDIRYLSATAAGDLRQIEAAGGATERSPLRLSNFAAAVAAAALCAFVLAVWILALELAFGTVRDAAELGAAEDVRVLGALPAPGAGEAAERDAARSAALAFCRAEESRGVVLVQALAGAAVPEAFSEALDWSLAMSGRRRFRLELVPGAGFAPPEGSETMTGVVRKGDRGWFPLSGLLALDQTEVRMLEADLAALRGSFDDVFVEAPAGLRGGPFLEQALGLAGSVLFVVAAGATPRRELRRARAVAARAGRPAAGIAVERASGAAGAKSGEGTMKRIPASTVAAALAALLLQGCLSGGSADRLYGGLEELSIADPAAAAADPAAPAAGEAEARRREALAALAAEPDPPYRIGPGDRIEVRVQDHPDIGGSAVVAPDGSVGLLFLGQVSVAGLTLAEARDAIERGLEPFVRHPVAGVSALEVASRNATVAGAVARPGAVPVSNGTRLADVCAQAGAAPDADLARSVLVRGGAAVPVDFRAAVERGDPLENVKVRPGDYVFLARREEAGVTICGEVRKPGVLPCAGGGRSLVGALAESGWRLETAWGSALVVREGPDGPRVWRVDVDGILAGEKRDVRVLPGDIVHVPPAEAGGAGGFGAPAPRRPAFPSGSW